MTKYCPLSLSPEEIIQFTPEWSGERFPDGRPRVPDDVLARMERVSITQAWGTCKNAGYRYQFEGPFDCTQPGAVLVGRAATAVYMPKRPDLRATIEEQGVAAGQVGDLVSWPIELLERDDVYVADVFGRVKDGPVIGENLATAIYSRTGKGVVHDASFRDIDGIKAITGFAGFHRGVHPTHASPETVVLMGINCPVRIGEVTVMPGDVVLAREDGVVFVPAQLALETVESAEIVTLKDEFGTMRIREGVYGPGEIDRAWSERMNEDFSGWLRSIAAERDIDPDSLERMLERLAGKRTW